MILRLICDLPPEPHEQLLKFTVLDTFWILPGANINSLSGPAWRYAGLQVGPRTWVNEASAHTIHFTSAQLARGMLVHACTCGEAERCKSSHL